MPKKRVMVINDTEEILELFRDIIEGEAGHEMVATTYKPHLMDEIEHARPDLIVCDYMFGGEAMGWQLVQKLRMNRETELIPIIICSGAVAQLRELEGVLAEKNIGILLKPFDVDDLLALMGRKLEEGSRYEDAMGDKRKEAK
jgi:CheY-like chemotaxis protein